MKAIFAIVVMMTLAGSAAPTFVTGRMIDRRNGLTDEQYEYLWSIGKHPQIQQEAARDWVFRAGRYQNVTNWLDICGKTNDFAKLSYDLQDRNFNLEATNLTLRALASRLEEDCTNLTYRCESWSNLYTVASAQAEVANAKIEGEIEDLQAKIEKYTEYKTKYPLLKTVWEALIADAENRIKILQAVAEKV